MSVVLLKVPGFGSYPDGRLRAGPFRSCGVTELHVIMERCGIRVGESGDTGMVSQMAEGVMLSASGSGVRGYFLDDEGLEAPETDLDRFMMSVNPPGVAFQVSGHWSPDPDRSIVSEAVAIHDGFRVTWSESRILLHSSGARDIIRRTVPSTIPAFARAR